MQKVYVEAVFADNFAVNFLILILASRLGCERVRWGRCALAAAVGGIYAAVAYGVGGFMVSLPVKLGISLIMCAAAYWARGEKHVLRGIVTFYIATFVLAGAIYAMGQALIVNGTLAVPAAVRAVLLGLAAGAALTGVYSYVRRRTLRRQPHIETLELRIGEKCMRVKAFIDTGNLLTEPISGAPVLFLSRAAAEKLLGAKQAAALAGGVEPDAEGLRIIPCATAAGRTVLYGRALDGVSLPGCGNSVKAVACIARSAPAGGSEAIAGSILTDELKKGAYHEKFGDAEDRGVAVAAPEAGGKRRLYQRQRGAAPAAFGRGGDIAADALGTGGQIGAPGADRAQPAPGGIHRAQV